MQRTTALSAWVSLALAYGAAQVAAQATLNTPGSLIECVPAAITWNGATGNVYLSAYDANNNRLAQYPTQTGASGTYSIGPVTFPVGADVHFVINDDTGVQNATGGVTVAAGTSDSCKNSSSSSSGSSSTGAAAGAGSSSSRSSSSSSSASRTSSSSSSSSTARSSSSSSSEPASSTSSSAAPTTSSSSSTAAPSSSTASVVSSAPSSTTQSDGAVSIDASAMRSFGVAALVGLAGLGFGAFAL